MRTNLVFSFFLLALFFSCNSLSEKKEKYFEQYLNEVFDMSYDKNISYAVVPLEQCGDCILNEFDELLEKLNQQRMLIIFSGKKNYFLIKNSIPLIKSHHANILYDRRNISSEYPLGIFGITYFP